MDLIRRNVRTPVLLAISGALAIAAVALGIDDNPPGVLLAYLAAFAFVLAFVHRWRSAGRFGWLVIASLFGMGILIVLDILATEGASDPETAGAFRNVLQGFAEAVFLIGSLILPAAFVTGIAGWVAALVRNRRRPA